MIRNLFQLSEKCKNGIYIYGINRTSLKIFFDLMLYRVKVCGFISDEKKFTKENIWNTNIYTIEEIETLRDAVVIVDKDNENFDKSEKLHYMSSNEVVTDRINTNLQKGSVYIYGCGEFSDEITHIVEKDGGTVEGYIISNSQNSGMFNNKPIYSYDDIELHEGDSVIVASKNSNSIKEILNKLDKDKCDIYLESITGWQDREENSFVYAISNALKSNRSLWIYGLDGNLSEFIREVLRSYDISIKRQVYIDVDDCLDSSVDNIFDLIDEDNSRITIIIALSENKNISEALEILCELGFPTSKEGITSLYKCTNSKDFLLRRNIFVKDSLVESSMRYPCEEFDGWKKLYANDGYTSKRIAVLGGSTSAYGCFYPETWEEKLFRKLNKTINVEMFIGARAGESVVHEFLRIIRDYDMIKPDLVISMSGVNNVDRIKRVQGFNLDESFRSLYESKRQFCKGINKDYGVFTFWLKIEKMIKNILESENIKFLPVLQPINYYMESMDLLEKMQFETDDYTENAKNLYDNSSDDDIYLNLIGLFHHKKGMYIDSAHYTEDANEILADIIYNEILGHNLLTID